MLMEFTASSAHSSTDNDRTILAQERRSIIIVAVVSPYERGCSVGLSCLYSWPTGSDRCVFVFQSRRADFAGVLFCHVPHARVRIGQKTVEAVQ